MIADEKYVLEYAIGPVTASFQANVIYARAPILEACRWGRAAISSFRSD